MSGEKKIPLVTKAILSLPYVKYLLNLVNNLIKKLGENKQKISDLEEELRRIKKVPKKPKIEASKLDEDPQKKRKDKGAKRAGSEKKKKKRNLPIDERRKIEAKGIPVDWVLIGYKAYVIQDVIISRHNIKYEREVWQSPDGKERIVAALPSYLEGRSFGSTIRCYIINLYNSCHVTQPLIWQHLQDIGVDISKGGVNFILNEDKANKVFEEELLKVVKQGMAVSKEIRTDDTSSRHQGKNGFCNCISSEFFTYFKTTSSKSRINFLKVLQLDDQGYFLNEDAIAYCLDLGLTIKYITILTQDLGLSLKNEEQLLSYFEEKKISAKYAKRIITEGLLIGSLIENGFDKNKIIHADDAGQFKVFLHCLCWKHAERPLKKVVIRNDLHQKQWNDKMGEFWQLYQDLKAYKELSSLAQKRRKQKLEEQFDKLCEEEENFEALNLVLAALKKKKPELLLVLEYPFVSLHNNETEGDIREYAKRRKISGSTRSDNGRKSRDVFTSLKKTCRKLGISFWAYTIDRIEEKNKIPPLPDILLQRVQMKFT